ncbi:MAG: 3-phosphoserine/phosphohydroxythreonine transaminase [Leptospiraceae bacterium]|nr:3-phosphoserine/phosphohydroxythreonine transaminase [Leptospiraceae bacterium]
MFSHRIHNFNAGPAAIPLPVLKKAQEEFLNFEGTGMSVMELSHRSKEFERVLERAIRGVRAVLDVPEDYAVLFIQGGASLQFAMVPMNLALPGKKIDLIQTGVWTQKAEKEARKFAEVHIAASTEAENFSRLPRPEELQLTPDASYVHICSNNTIFGTEYNWLPETGDVPLVADMSSNIASRPIDVRKYGLIFAGAQKNLGPAGVALVIMRQDLAERAPKNLPTMLQYRTYIAENSLYNTPPTFGIYMIALTMEYILEIGGIRAVEARNMAKAETLYSAIDNSGGFYRATAHKPDRSRMNVNFRIWKNNTPDEALEKQFVAEAEKAGFAGLKGHRSVGGLRASLYNAVEQHSVNELVRFMQDFARRHG